MASHPVLSLVIPTRERAKTLAFTLASALDQRGDDYEIVVSDNASTDGTRDVVDKAGDARVRYFNTGQRLSMCDNYEFALEQVRGDYVIFIGDDDAALPGGLDHLIGLLQAEEKQVIRTWPLNVYDWPNDEGPGRVAYLAPSRPPSAMRLKAKARRVLELGAWKYYELPSPYHCAVPTWMLSAIRDRTGRVFHSTQPDVFTAMAIPAFADEAVNIGTPITLHGRSSQSNGIDFFKRSAQANIQRFIREYGAYAFHPTLYPGVSGAANMIPDAVLLARDMFPGLYAGQAFNYSAMWAYICRLGFANYREVLTQVPQIRHRHRLSVTAFLALSTVHELSALRRKALNRITLSGSSERQAESNIHDFARRLARSGTAALA